MQRSARKAALVAVDLGAQSCRISILRSKQGVSQIEVIHRFSNAPISTDTGLYWNIEAIFDGVSAGLRMCAEAAPEGIASIGVDGWAVDYVRGVTAAHSEIHFVIGTRERQKQWRKFTASFPRTGSTHLQEYNY